MTVYLLPLEPYFPPPEEAEPDGLIAVGGDLSVPRLIEAYASGIFPWFNDDEDFYWYSPDPRLLMYPDGYHIPDSLRRIVKKQVFEVLVDTNFDQVIRLCSDRDRPGQDGTWISSAFVDGYTELHRQGFAHSVETYYKGNLVGGLYGVSLGAAFFGESMFYTMNNASKVAFHALVELARQKEFRFIDCQVETSHLLKLGARLVARKDYLEMLSLALQKPTDAGVWT